MGLLNLATRLLRPRTALVVIVAVLAAGFLGGCANLPSNLYREVVLDEPLPQRLREGDLGGAYRTEPSPGTMRFSENDGIPLCDKNAKLTVWLDSDGVVRAKRLATSGDCWLIPFVLRRSWRRQVAVSVGEWMRTEPAERESPTVIEAVRAKHRSRGGPLDLAACVADIAGEKDVSELLAGKEGRRWLAGEAEQAGVLKRGNWRATRERGRVLLHYRHVTVDSAIGMIMGAKALAEGDWMPPLFQWGD